MSNMASNKFINSSANDMFVSASRPSDEVKIKLKHGEWEVEITCSEARVKQMVETVLSSIDSTKFLDPAIMGQLEDLRRQVEAIKSRPEPAILVDQKPVIKGGTTCRGLLEGLWYEGYFAKERSLADVHEELSRRGYNYDRTAVSHSLTDMVRETILTRIGTMRNYRYIQKRPPSDRQSTAGQPSLQ